MTANYILDIVFLLTAAVIAVPLFRAIGLGAVPGFLMAGVVVGPSGFGLIDNVTDISHLAELGVVLLLFVVGIELKPSAGKRTINNVSLAANSLCLAQGSLGKPAL